MCYLHSKNILHGDLCGGNVLLCSATRDERGFVTKLADFGLARYIEEDAIMTSTYGTVNLGISLMYLIVTSGRNRQIMLQTWNPRKWDTLHICQGLDQLNSNSNLNLNLK